MPLLSDDCDGVGGATMIGGGTTKGGGGGGGGVRWAWAEVDANASVSAKAIAKAVASLRREPIFLRYEGPAEQRINIIPKKSSSGEKYQNHHRLAAICAQLFRSVNRSWPRPPAD
jgi:hypothetical protein